VTADRFHSDGEEVVFQSGGVHFYVSVPISERKRYKRYVAQGGRGLPRYIWPFS